MVKYYCTNHLQYELLYRKTGVWRPLTVMEIPDWKIEAAENSDDEVSVDKSHHYRLGPENLDDTLEYGPVPCDPAALVHEEDGSPAASE